MLRSRLAYVALQATNQQISIRERHCVKVFGLLFLFETFNQYSAIYVYVFKSTAP